MGLLSYNVDKFPRVYTDLLYQLLTTNHSEVNERTGTKIKTLEGGCSFRLDLADGLIPVPGARRVYPKTAAAEVAWFLRGEQDTDWIGKYTKIWDKFTEDDGKVEAAYGYRWRKRFGRDQIQRACEALSKNPTDRRIFVSAWDPATDGLGEPDQKNVPCPLGFTLSIVDDQLHSSLFIRSSDVFVGLPYDIMGHAMLMGIFAHTIQSWPGAVIVPGIMHVTLAHPHLYEPHFDMARRCVCMGENGQTVSQGPLLQYWHLDDVTINGDDFVQAYIDADKKVSHPKYNPRPELVL